MNDFGLGLQVTAWGMGLVFGTLIIVAVVIWALDKGFRPKAGADKEEESPLVVETETAEPSGSSLVNEAAAIVVALALEAKRAAKPRAATAAQPFLAPVRDEDVLGEVVTVATFDPGPGMWKSHGRITSTI
jgi:Na+-transporting methylmalonyl-CoA/oxaloacetate decarboxylase gamma subunit